MSVKARFTFKKIPLEDWGLTEVTAVVLVIVQMCEGPAGLGNGVEMRLEEREEARVQVPGSGVWVAMGIILHFGKHRLL